MKRFLSRKGFTLLELILVILIMGTITYLAVGALETASTREKVKTTANQFLEIARAAQIFYLTQKDGEARWPYNISDLIDAKLLKTNNNQFRTVYAGSFIFQIDYCHNALWVSSVQSSASWEEANEVASLIPGAYITRGSPEFDELDPNSGATQPSGPRCAFPPPKDKRCCPLKTDPTSVWTYPPAEGTIRKEKNVVMIVPSPGVSVNQSRQVRNTEVLRNNGCYTPATCFENDVREVRVVPVGVVGILNESDKDASGAYNIYPIQSFQAYTIVPDKDQAPAKCSNVMGNDPNPCGINQVRVCLDVGTSSGRSEDVNSLTVPGQVFVMSYCKKS